VAMDEHQVALFSVI